MAIWCSLLAAIVSLIGRPLQHALYRRWNVPVWLSWWETGGVVALAALVGAALGVVYPASFRALVLAIGASGLLVIAQMDFRTRLSSDVLTVGGGFVLVALHALAAALDGRSPVGVGTYHLLGGLIGAAIWGLFFLIGRIAFRREALATGDITIGFFIGCLIGGSAPWATVPLGAHLAGTYVSGLVALGLFVVRRARGEFFPYGPGMAIGAIAALIFGQAANLPG